MLRNSTKFNWKCCRRWRMWKKCQQRTTSAPTTRRWWRHYRDVGDVRSEAEMLKWRWRWLSLSVESWRQPVRVVKVDASFRFYCRTSYRRSLVFRDHRTDAVPLHRRSPKDLVSADVPQQEHTQRAAGARETTAGAQGIRGQWREIVALASRRRWHVAEELEQRWRSSTDRWTNSMSRISFTASST